MVARIALGTYHVTLGCSHHVSGAWRSWLHAIARHPTDIGFISPDIAPAIILRLICVLLASLSTSRQHMVIECGKRSFVPAFANSKWVPVAPLFNHSFHILQVLFKWIFINCCWFTMGRVWARFLRRIILGCSLQALQEESALLLLFQEHLKRHRGS